MSPPNPLAPPNLRGRRTVGVDVGPAGPIIVPVLFSRWLPSIAAFEEGTGCGARQWHRDGAPGGAGSYVTGPARPKAATPGNRGPAVARAEPRIWVRHPRVAPPGAPFPFWGNGKRETTGRPGRPNSKPGIAKSCLKVNGAMAV